MKKETGSFYLKKIGERGNFKIWIVDGNYIRTNIDEEFTNYGQHYRFKFIPKNEFWIDRGANEREENYYIDHLLEENKLMSRGKSYECAISFADRIERRERSKSNIFKKFIQNIFPHKKVPKKIYEKILHDYKGIKVWLVNGELVRNLFYVDFTEGGHDKVYSFIPEREIWIDDNLASKERKFVLLHELHERNLMNKGIKYPLAHKDSSNIEYFARHNPKKFKKIILNELKMMRSFSKIYL